MVLILPATIIVLAVCLCLAGIIARILPDWIRDTPYK